MIFFLPVISACLLWAGVYWEKFSWFSWFGLVPLLFYVKFSSSKRNNFFGDYLFGFVYFILYFSWLLELKKWVGFIIFLGFIFLSVYQGFFYFLWLRSVKFFYKKLNSGFFCIVPPVTFLIFEWLRGAGPYGITFGNWALGQHKNLFLLKISEFAGIYGILFFIILFNALIFKLFDNFYEKKEFKNQIFYLILILLIFYLFRFGEKYFKENLKENEIRNELNVALIQPNISQEERLKYSNIYQNLEKQIELSEKVRFGNASGLIVWPEALPLVLNNEDDFYFKKIKDFVKKQKVFLLFGAFTRDTNGKLLNSALLLSREGKILGVYSKHQPVPFGEYLPFKFIFYPFVKHTGFFEDDQVSSPLKVLKIEGLPGNPIIGVEICFESTFPLISRKLTLMGAEIFFVLTNDAWFGKSRALDYHFNFLPFRAVENGRYFCQVAGTGISGVLSPEGRVIAKINSGVQDILILKIPLIKKHTFYVFFGDWLIFLSFFIVIFLFFRYGDLQNFLKKSVKKQF